MTKSYILIYFIAIIVEIFATYRSIKKKKDNNKVSFFILPIIGFSFAAAATSNAEISKNDLATILGVYAIGYSVYCGIWIFQNATMNKKKDN